MAVERNDSRPWRLTRSSRGAAVRYAVTPPVLAFWLCGWAAGESGFALWMMILRAVAILDGQPHRPDAEDTRRLATVHARLVAWNVPLLWAKAVDGGRYCSLERAAGSAVGTRRDGELLGVRRVDLGFFISLY
jgi:hypothetical protein